MLRSIFIVLLLLIPPALLCGCLAKAKLLNLWKAIGITAIFLGGALAYAHHNYLGIAGLMLALAGLLCYLEAIREDVFLEMKRLSTEEDKQTAASEEERK